MLATMPQMVKLMNVPSSIDEAGLRSNQRLITIQKYGKLCYKVNRVRIQTRYQITMLLFNIKTFGLFRTIKVWIGCGN